MATRKLVACVSAIRTWSAVKSCRSISSCVKSSRLHLLSKESAVCTSHKGFSTTPMQQKDTAKVTFLLRDGSSKTIDATVGENLLDIIIEHDVDIDGYGACEGTLSCSTCHLIFSQEDYDKLSSKPTDEELDMLDLAFGLEDTSRLGCQVVVTKDLDGAVIQVPQGVADARSAPL